jgi:hypothetical protein
MTATLSHYTALETLSCWCGLPFAAPSELLRECRRDSNQKCYCPLGHVIVWRKTEADRLREQLAAKQAEVDRANARIADQRVSIEHKDRKLIAAKGQMTKLKKRVAHGVCPCCKRHFKELHRHMQTEHPEFVTTD